jgi:hypothetical protein
VSPTLLTWLVGAGMIVLVSAISFSAGYATGRLAGNTSGSTSGSGSDYASESVTAVRHAASASGIKRNLATKGAAAGLGWAGSVSA